MWLLENVGILDGIGFENTDSALCRLRISRAATAPVRVRSAFTTICGAIALVVAAGYAQ